MNSDVQLLTRMGDRGLYQLLTFYPITPVEGIAAQLISNIHHGVILLDQHLNILDINEAACRLLEIDQLDSLNQSIRDSLSKLELESADWSRLFVAFQSSPPTARTEEITIRKDGIIRNLSFRIFPIRETEVNFQGWFLWIENVTTIRSLEQQIRQNNRLATIGQIAAGTAHEIRNPLTSIRGFLQMIGYQLQQSGQVKEQGYIDLMLKEIGRINSLVGEFLLLSKPREVHIETVDVCQVLEEIVPIIHNEALLHNVDVQMERFLPPSYVVHADGELLKQIFLNVSKNAIEAMCDGGSLTIQLETHLADSQLTVKVIDTGPGIPKHVMDKIYDPFFTTKENGTGLGLPICRQILREIGGSIYISTQTLGTTVGIKLPLAKQNQPS
ncbi:ATP-binding protein [Hazenella coriacea]|uniref:histidine kinase n=1 Tax=Hazenella coriacea TaxID=1179467 RepID=A0A4R3L723_9BACL|nr:ATP-binding protein [Hazenella coriacea]TCS95439.1 PAS domain S-box-containing protein [Hazenella coriacea]